MRPVNSVYVLKCYSISKRKLNSQVASLFGGRIAEELVYGEDAVTTGASNDIERATEIAHKMVKLWGMSSVMGPGLWRG